MQREQIEAFVRDLIEPFRGEDVDQEEIDFVVTRISDRWLADRRAHSESMLRHPSNLSGRRVRVTIVVDNPKQELDIFTGNVGPGEPPWMFWHRVTPDAAPIDLPPIFKVYYVDDIAEAAKLTREGHSKMADQAREAAGYVESHAWWPCGCLKNEAEAHRASCPHFKGTAVEGPKAEMLEAIGEALKPHGVDSITFADEDGGDETTYRL